MAGPCGASVWFRENLSPCLPRWPRRSAFSPAASARCVAARPSAHGVASALSVSRSPGTCRVVFQLACPDEVGREHLSSTCSPSLCLLRGSVCHTLSPLLTCVFLLFLFRLFFTVKYTYHVRVRLSGVKDRDNAVRPAPPLATAPSSRVTAAVCGIMAPSRPAPGKHQPSLCLCGRLQALRSGDSHARSSSRRADFTSRHVLEVHFRRSESPSLWRRNDPLLYVCCTWSALGAPVLRPSSGCCECRRCRRETLLRSRGAARSSAAGPHSTSVSEESLHCFP